MVAFIDFHDKDFDGSVSMAPSVPDRIFWKNMFATALDDLAELAAPSIVVFCEGDKIGSRSSSFDASVYTRIFSQRYPDASFIGLGGSNEVSSSRGKPLRELVLNEIVPGVVVKLLVDRDNKTSQEITDDEESGISVLRKRDIENYLWDDEILMKLATSNGRDDSGDFLVSEKRRLLSSLPSGSASDDVKKITGDLFSICTKHLSLTQRGNTKQSFARDTLTPLITPDTAVYKELEQIIFPRSQRIT